MRLPVTQCIGVQTGGAPLFAYILLSILSMRRQLLPRASLCLVQQSISSDLHSRKLSDGFARNNAASVACHACFPCASATCHLRQQAMSIFTMIDRLLNQPERLAHCCA
ncbi:hypothetical protein Bphy_5525 [Paraburkholderia phymatum STM815]|uniref:Uncharacterized protein n=1 Tax=Paraburkholderia phymatum (strain DSM 17167 / CIP 108236 / LMG 21445 / STM815) TaxID=391038 RepID=B2JP48_PARP8|nr:hypothetical protein Bphy_5525 [Paraburkholderia phymatum STM815]